MRRCEQQRCNENERNLCRRTLSKEFTQPLEHPAAKKRFLAEACAEDDCVKHARNHRRVTGCELKCLIDWRCTEKRHHHRFHREFEHDAKDDAESNCFCPTAWPHVTDLAPW